MKTEARKKWEAKHVSDIECVDLNFVTDPKNGKEYKLEDYDIDPTALNCESEDDRKLALKVIKIEEAGSYGGLECHCPKCEKEIFVDVASNSTIDIAMSESYHVECSNCKRRVDVYDQIMSFAEDLLNQ